MKAAIYPNTKLEDIPRKIDAIHLVRPMSIKKIEKILRRCGKCRKVTLSKSCFERLPAKTKALLKRRGIELELEAKQGRAIGISLERMLHAIELRKDYQSLREIERITQIPKSTVHYLLKYAAREKIKKGNAVIYLK